MTTAKVKKREKELHVLIEETNKLHKDVEQLEDAYQLHRRMVDQDKQGPRAIIRKEIGGARWQHGGAGKLTTYKNNKDLNESATPNKPENDKKQVNGTSSKRASRNTSRKSADRKREARDDGNTYTLYNKDNSRGKHDSEGHDENNSLNGTDRDDSTMLDLKTKVLKKASAKVIKRDTWAHQNDAKSKSKTAEASNENKRTFVAGKVNNNVISSKSSKSDSDKRKTSVKKVNKDTVHSDLDSSRKTIVKEKQGTDDEGHMKKNGSSEKEVSVHRRSRLDMFRSQVDETNESQSEAIPSGRSEKSSHNVNGDIKALDEGNGLSSLRNSTFVTDLQREQSLTYTPLHTSSENTIGGSRLFQTQPPDATEIFIDPENFEVRVKPGSQENTNEISSLNGTNISIKQGTIRKSIDGVKAPCSVVDRQNHRSPGHEVRDIFGFGDFDANAKSELAVSSKYDTSPSPFASSKECDSEVEFWLRGLGLADAERYVSIFAANEIDLLDLEFMSASQLHDMGISAVGALNKILMGVRDLKNQSAPPKGKGRSKSKKKHLDAASIAWKEEAEDIDDVSMKKTFMVKSKNKLAKEGNKPKSCHNETFTKGSKDTKSGKYDKKELKGKKDVTIVRRKSLDITSVKENESLRCSSVMSEHSDTLDMLSSARSTSLTQNMPFSVATKASNAKCVEKRPSSAKKEGKHTSESKSKVARSDSNVSEKSGSRLTSLESKPTRSVLLRPRSSSLTREGVKGPATRGRKDDEGKGTRKDDEGKGSRGVQVRARSRSADNVRRKALEGVQAAAKKFEVRHQHSKGSEVASARDERLKLRRDEMAARHLEREKHKELVPVESSESDEECPDPSDPIQQGLESLVTVNIMSQPTTSDPEKSGPQKSDRSKTRVIASQRDVRASLRRVEPARRHTRNLPVKPLELELESEIDRPLLATYKLGDQDPSPRSQSEPESGYKTDGSSTYNHVQGRVADIQSKIKRLKSRATSGDEMTLTLVRDLQIQLRQFESQLAAIDGGARPGRNAHTQGAIRSNNGEPAIPYPSPRKPFSSGAGETYSSSAVDQYLSSGPAVGMDTHGLPQGSGADPTLRLTGDDAHGGGADVRMSKRELIDEMRKEKHQHNRQIRQLQSELHRIRHTDPAWSLELNQRDISFRHEDMIGEGTFSQVFKGQYQGAEVAVKRLCTPLQTQDRNYFAAEVSLLKELRHPRVVLLIGVCTSDRLPVMVLEYMSHGSLYNHLHDSDSDPLDHALYYQVSRDIALGMNYLHQHKPEVLHLDLKSMNVLLCHGLRAKIADFGFSKLRHEAGQRGKSRPSPATPVWMSPELLDKGEINGKSDVYSFGIILWEMLTRQVPYENCSVFQVLERVRKNKRPLIPASCPEGLRQLISQCWSSNPARRPQFKDINPTLENLAFPPSWRELFQEAGVPDEALHDLDSTRTIISLVNNNLDSPDPHLLNTFKLEPEHSGNHTLSKSAREVTASSAVGKDVSTREVIRSLDKWECDTVSTLSGRVSSDESELTLKNLRESVSDLSSGSSDEDDESSDYLSDEEQYPSSTMKQIVDTSIVPQLELSLKSAREEFASERDRIERTADWLSISLDDRTDRSSVLGNYKPSLDTDMQIDASVHILSNRGSRSGTPVIQVSTEGLQMNESARSRRRNKTKDLPSYSEEYMMRESFHNRRPPSPKKRKSLTKKLLERSVGSVDELSSTATSLASRSDGAETISSQTFKTVDASHDSFFGISLTDLSRKNPKTIENNSTSLSDSRREIVGISSLDSDQGSGEIPSSEAMFIPIENDQSEQAEQVDETKHKNLYVARGLVTELDKMITETKALVSDLHESANKLPGDKVMSSQEFKMFKLKPAENLSYSSKTAATENKTSTRYSVVGGSTENKTSPRYSVVGGSSPRYSVVGGSVGSSMIVDTDQHNAMKDEKDDGVSVIRSLNDRFVSVSKDLEKGNSVADRRQDNSSKDRSVPSSTKTSKDEMVLTLSTDSKDKFAPSPRTDSKDKFESSTRTDSKDKFVPSSNSNSKDISVLSLRNSNEDKAVSSMDRFVPSSSNHSNDISPSSLRTSSEYKVVSSSSKRNKDKSSIASNKTNNDELVSLSSKEFRIRKNEHSVDVNTDIGRRVNEELKTVSKKVTSDKVSIEKDDKKENDVEQIRVKLNLEEVMAKKKPSVTPRRSKQSQQKENRTEYSEDIASMKTSLTSSVTDIKTSPGRQSTDRDKGEVPNFSPGRKAPSGKSLEKSKKHTIRVKLRKDPLAPKLSTEPTEPSCSPIPPAPPPPPRAVSASVSFTPSRRSIPEKATAHSMADELKLRLASRQSISDGLVRPKQNNTAKPVRSENIIGGHQSEQDQASRPASQQGYSSSGGGKPKMVGISEITEGLMPQQSEGEPAFMVQSYDLQEQKDHLRSISHPHPDQLDDLSHASKEQLSSIAEILKKAVLGRRLAMREDGDSVSQSMESAATGWSIDTTT